MPRSIQYYRGVNPLLRLGSDILSQKSSKNEDGCFGFGREDRLGPPRLSAKED